MKTNTKLAIGAALLSVLLAADECSPPPVKGPGTQLDQQRKAAVKAVQAEQTHCYECSNIQRRRILMGKPGLITYIVFLNYAGQPIQYIAVDGKCTSSGKKLENNYETRSVDKGEFYGSELVPGPGDDGTYGTSEPYIFCFDTAGAYHQWSGEYLVSDKPFDLTIKPLVIDISGKTKVSGQ